MSLIFGSDEVALFSPKFVLDFGQNIGMESIESDTHTHGPTTIVARLVQ